MGPITNPLGGWGPSAMAAGGSKGFVEAAAVAAADWVGGVKGPLGEPMGSMTDLIILSACAMPSCTRAVKVRGGCWEI